jgi:4-hydroxybenzoate polyprenyltransferase
MEPSAQPTAPVRVGRAPTGCPPCGRPLCGPASRPRTGRKTCPYERRTVTRASTPASGQGLARPTQLAFWRAYLTTTRPYLFPISALAGLTGMSLAHVTDPWRWGIALFVFSLSYGLGQALTDCFQQDTDRLSAPYRPLVQGRVATRHMLMVSLAGLIAGLAILGWLNPWNVAAAAGAVVGLLAYTPLKRRWWAGPIANAWVVGLLPIMGWLVEPGNSLLSLMRYPEVLALAAMSFAAYANFVLVGYLKDISADRQAHYHTFPVVFGWRATAAISHLWALGAFVAAAWLVGHRATAGQPPPLLAAGVLVLAFLLSARTQFMLPRLSGEAEAYKPLANTARVFLLLAIAVLLSVTPAWLPVAAALYLAFEVLLFLRPERSQI